MQTHKQLLA
jgi:hypothetical protein